ncbi:hypothetical protein RvY_00756 [Ramazzottius varieornatus]|uniref:Uncharacterized protein n=1 Tax=Ramazzottius varieornatus TaxID=947166 RepID=A0A1D1UDW5_RAMVA|nr:hypothetical protein RvY_00756 [Ramazzottius varieornatus]
MSSCGRSKNGMLMRCKDRFEASRGRLEKHKGLSPVEFGQDDHRELSAAAVSEGSSNSLAARNCFRKVRNGGALKIVTEISGSTIPASGAKVRSVWVWAANLLVDEEAPSKISAKESAKAKEEKESLCKRHS